MKNDLLLTYDFSLVGLIKGNVQMQDFFSFNEKIFFCCQQFLKQKLIRIYNERNLNFDLKLSTNKSVEIACRCWKRFFLFTQQISLSFISNGISTI